MNTEELFPSFAKFKQEIKEHPSLSPYLDRNNAPHPPSLGKDLIWSSISAKMKEPLHANARLCKSLENIPHEITRTYDLCTLSKSRSFCSVNLEDYTFGIPLSGNFCPHISSKDVGCFYSDQKEEKVFRKGNSFRSVIYTEDLVCGISPYSSIKSLGVIFSNEMKYFSLDSQKAMENAFEEHSMDNFDILPLIMENSSAKVPLLKSLYYSTDNFAEEKQQRIKINNVLTVAIENRKLFKLSWNSQHSKHLLLEDMNSSVLLRSNDNTQTKSNYFFNDVYAYKPRKIGTTLSSKSTLCVDKSVRRKSDYNHSFYTTLKPRKAHCLAPYFCHKQKISDACSSVLLPDVDYSLKSINSFSFLLSEDSQMLIEVYDNEIFSKYGSFKSPRVLSDSLSNKFISSEVYNYSKKCIDEIYLAETCYVEKEIPNYLVPVKCNKISSGTECQMELLGYLIQKFAPLVEMFNQSKEFRSLFFKPKQNKSKLNIFSNSDLQAREIVSYKVFDNISSFDNNNIPKICLKIHMDFDNITNLQSYSNTKVSTSRSALKRSPKPCITFIIYGKLRQRKLNEYNFHSEMERNELYQNFRIDSEISFDTSCFTLHISSNSSNALGYNTSVDTIFHKRHLDLYQVHIKVKQMIDPSRLLRNFTSCNNLWTPKPSKYFTHCVQHSVPTFPSFQPLNHLLPYILAAFCDSRRLPENPAHYLKHVVSRGQSEFRIDDQRLVAFAMDWMRTIGSDVMISDDQLTTVLQHLLVSVEKGIERLEWTGIAKTWPNSSGSSQSSTFPRCCHVASNPVDTKDSSVQTTPESDVDKDPDAEVLDPSKPDIALDLRNYSCVSSDPQIVSVVERNYVPNCESIATQTSELSPSKLHDLPKSENDLMFGLAPVAVREEDPDDGYCEHILTQPATISQVDQDLLHSQIALLPGCRDLKGRSVVIINSDVIKDCVQLSACHLAQLLLYFHTIPKKEVVCKGFLVLIDGTKASEEFWNVLDETFCLIEANLSNVISEVIVYLPPGEQVLDSSAYFRTSRVQNETVSSCDKLQNFIHKEQLLSKYGGSYVYDHQEWISFRKFLEPFINGCRLSGRHLVNLLEELRGSRIPVSSSLTHQMIEQQKRTVSHTFHDEQLRHLEEEGDTILKELQSYRVRSPHNHDYRENLERTVILYDELRKAMTKLARLADKRLNRLEECLQLKTFQEESSQVLSWLCRKGNESLEKHQSIADSLGAIKQQEEEFEKFYFLAMRQIEKGNDLLEEVSTFGQDSALSKNRDENSSETVEDRGGVQELATSLKQHLGSFSEKLEGTRERIEDTAKCYQLMDKSYEWALDAMRFVSNMGITNTENPEGIIRQIRCLQDYSDNHLRVPEDTFTEMLEIASRLGNEKLLEQCKVVKLRCEETVELIQARQATLQKVKQQMEVDSLRGPFWEAEDATQTPRTIRSHSQPMNSWLPGSASTPYTSAVMHHQRRRSTGGHMGVSSQQRYGTPIGSYTSFPTSYYPSSRESYQLDSYIQEKEDHLLNHGLITEDLTSNGPVASISKTLLDTRISHKEGHSSLSASSSSSYTKDLSNIFRSSGRSSSSSSSESKSCKRLTRRCQMWQLRDEALEKAKAEVREQTALLRVERLHNKLDENSTNRSETSETPSTEKLGKKTISQVHPDPVRGPVPVNTHLMSQASPDVPDHSAISEEVSNSSEAKSKKTLMLIMKELIQTERDYVKSLEYIIENYIPELMREDIPQALRGQRNVVFGNIEKIYEFHDQYFLTELEHCENNPFIVGQCFLDFQPQFYLYALYNKNKPKSDALMSEYGNTFFRKKQLELQDKMDLASYLLKPVQRMGKYALLLKQLLKECPERETEHKALKAAEEMVRFQLRHGNDLLAMDALKDSDVNVKEQGRLLRQDEFIVWQGRSRKCMRHVFLFEDLILFSKARRDTQRKGYEMYQYKHSIKTTDLGITEQIGDSPTKFEIWFRKRKLNDTFLLQAPNPEVKAAWVSDLRKILVKQAVKNRENRLAEMSSMGIGNKPCLDIKPSEDQISDRSISIHQLARAPRFRNSIAVSPYDLRNRNSIISVSSSSSSGSSQSSFSFYGTLNLGFEPGDSPRPLHRSHTQQSQCSTESGFCTDASTTGDSPDSEEPRHKRAERSDSLLSSDSLSTNVSPTDVPCMKYEQSFEESLTTPM